MGSPANYTVSSRFIIGNIDNSNESNDEFEEESNFIDVEEEDTSEINLSNEMDTSTMYNEYEDHDSELIPADDDFGLYNSREIDVTEGTSTTDSEGDVDENINQETKRIKLDNEALENGLESSDVADKCPICLELAWTCNGKHRLCSLRCGHLFGYNCIKLWLNSDNSGTKNCPQCQAKASIRHIRFLYANKLTSLDKSEFERMKEELKEARLKASEAAKALVKEKQRTKKYKKMYKARTLALTADSDFCFSD